MVMVAGCPKKGTVTATCTDIQKYHSDLGTVNLPLYALGKVLMLSTAGNEKRAYSVAALLVPDNGTVPGAGADKLTVKLDTSFALVFDIDVSDAVKAQTSASLTNGTNVELKNVNRTDLADAIALVEANASLKEKLKNAAADPNRRFVVVSSVKRADGLEIKLSNDAQGHVGADLLKYGKYELSVKYKCDGLIKLEGHAPNTSVFYGITPVKYDASTDKVVLDDRPINVWEYDHSQSLQDE